MAAQSETFDKSLAYMRPCMVCIMYVPMYGMYIHVCTYVRYGMYICMYLPEALDNLPQVLYSLPQALYNLPLALDDLPQACKAYLRHRIAYLRHWITYLRNWITYLRPCTVVQPT